MVERRCGVSDYNSNWPAVVDDEWYPPARVSLNGLSLLYTEHQRIRGVA